MIIETPPKSKFHYLVIKLSCTEGEVNFHHLHFNKKKCVLKYIEASLHSPSLYNPRRNCLKIRNVGRFCLTHFADSQIYFSGDDVSVFNIEHFQICEFKKLLSIRLLKHISINAVCVNTDYLILTNDMCYSFLLYPEEEKK